MYQFLFMADAYRGFLCVCAFQIPPNQIYIMIAFSNTLREYRINEQRVFPRLVCNGESLHQFAMSHGADRTAKKIGRFLPGKVTISDMAMIPEEEKLYVSFR
ncbi:DUF3718 domain-containing protein [Shewanella algae]|nr:DUF3718 domain-containing protein [Shewanella algae]